MGIEAIAAWATPRGLAGVVWISLPCGLVGQRGVIPRSDEIVGYLQTLKGTVLAVAKEYVRRTPAQINTAYRQLIEQALGWSYSPRPDEPV